VSAGAGVPVGVVVGVGFGVAERVGWGVVVGILVGVFVGAFVGDPAECEGAGVLDVTGAVAGPRDIRVPTSSPIPASRITTALAMTMATAGLRRLGASVARAASEGTALGSGSVRAGSGFVGGSCSPMGSVGSSLMRDSLRIARADTAWAT
jgi:hypothetical protein